MYNYRLQDFYDGGMKKDREDPRWRVDRLLVGDVGAASLSEQFWPVMSASQGQPRRIHVTGWRAMDRLYGLDREEAETNKICRFALNEVGAFARALRSENSSLSLPNSAKNIRRV